MESLEKVLSPVPLRSDENPKSFIKALVRESQRIGLVLERDGFVMLNPALDDEARDPKTGDELLSFTISKQIFSKDNAENNDLAKVMAWYLSQDVYEAPGTWTEAETALEEQIGGTKLGLNDARWGQFEDWGCYLGFAWCHSCNKVKKLTPDPTRYLKYCLKEIFQHAGEKILPIKVLFDKLSEQCPVIEGGRFRNEIHQLRGIKNDDTLSSVTSFALSRLDKAGFIRMTQTSDAELMVLTGVSTTRCSEITWIGKGE